MPKTTIRPSGASDAQLGVEGVAAAHVEDDVDLLAAVGLEDRRLQVVGARVDGGVGAEPLDQRPLLLAGGERRSPCAPARLASWTARVPVPPAAASTTTVSPGSTRAQRCSSAMRGQPLQQQRRRLVVVDLVGERDQQRLGHRGLADHVVAAEQLRDRLLLDRRRLLEAELVERLLDLAARGRGP